MIKLIQTVLPIINAIIFNIIIKLPFFISRAPVAVVAIKAIDSF